MTYTVYKHTNRANGKVYIGITRQAVERRWQKGAGYAGTLFGSAIQKYGWDAFEHEVLCTGLTKEAACMMEIELIAAYKSNDRVHGYNVSEGGETADYVKGKVGAENPRAAAVRRIDPNTGEVVEYRTIKDASVDMGINHRGISKACQGIAQTYRGYVWEYIDKRVDKKPAVGVGNYDHAKLRKPITVEEPDGTTRTFGSTKEASEKLGVKRCSITRFLRGMRKDASGRRWSYCP